MLADPLGVVLDHDSPSGGAHGSPLTTSSALGRRAASLDFRRATAASSAGTEIELRDPEDGEASSDLRSADAGSKSRRASFPRLSIMSWRQTPGKADADADANLTDPSEASCDYGGVELKSGHGTLYTTAGLRGGFSSNDSPPAKTRHVGLHSSRGGSSDYDLEEDETASSTRTPSSSRNRVLVSPSPSLAPIDSGFSEFGPSSILQEDRFGECPGASQDPVKTLPTPVQAKEDLNPDAKADPVKNTEEAARKQRSRGWFSFGSATVPAKDSDGLPGDRVGTREHEESPDFKYRQSPSHPSASGLGQQTQGQHQTASMKSTRSAVHANAPASTPPTKGSRPSTSMFLRSPGRKRGDSEVSMKEFSHSGGPL